MSWRPDGVARGSMSHWRSSPLCTAISREVTACIWLSLISTSPRAAANVWLLRDRPHIRSPLHGQASNGQLQGPTLVLDDDTVVDKSDKIVAWAEADPKP